MAGILHAADTGAIAVTCRWPSGDVFITRQRCQASLRVADLGIPLARRAYTLLKGSTVMEDEMRFWNEGDNTSAELTCVMTRPSFFVMNVYIGVCIENDYTASH